MQVFYAAFQALLYALCYQLECLLAPEAASVAAAATALGRIQLPSAEAPSPVKRPGPSPSPAQQPCLDTHAAVRQLFAELIPQLLNHR